MHRITCRRVGITSVDRTRVHDGRGLVASGLASCRCALFLGVGLTALAIAAWAVSPLLRRAATTIPLPEP